jgi:tetrapyrrole methylase family protein/MazG family protein
MGRVSIVDIGRAPDAPERRVLERLSEAHTVVAPSKDTCASPVLTMAGAQATSYADHGMALDAPADHIVETLKRLSVEGDVVLAASGYPFLREGVVMGLLQRVGPVRVLPASSPLEVLLMAFDVDISADLDLIDAKALRSAVPERGSHLVVTGVPNAIAAKAVSKRLAELYPGDHIVVIAVAEEGGGYELRMSTISSLPATTVEWPDATLYVAPFRVEPPGGFDELVRIMAVLRGPDGCPWDHEQTHMTLRRHMIEEAYEAVAAIENDDMPGLADELGDILLQVVFHAQIAAENGEFTIDDSVANIVAKLRRRHPHIFGHAVAETPAAVMSMWDRIKRDERGERGDSSILDGIAHTLPALTYADKMSRRAVAVGFDWETVDDVWVKVHEEIDELKAEAPGSAEAADEVGDLLFTIVNVARKLKVDPEQALRSTCDKFQRRFGQMESEAASRGEDLSDMGLEEMEALWRLAKQTERGGAAKDESGQP